jgi:muconolactone delta-isomerase
MKFLVVWRIDIAAMSRGIVSSILAMPDYAAPLEAAGKVVGRYHVVGAHGGAWIYDVASNEELERLLVQSPVYNYSHYDVYPLAEMTPPKPAG